MASRKKNVAVGIDFGTTNCSISVLTEAGKFESLGSIPSYFYFDEGNFYCGEAAKKKSEYNPQNSVFGIKRLIGLDFSEAQREITEHCLPFKLNKDETGGLLVTLSKSGQSLDFPLTYILAHLLMHVKKHAEQYTKIAIEEAIICVPSFFSSRQRKFIITAAEYAGFRDVQLLNESTAALIGLQTTVAFDKIRENVIILDCGGGFISVTAAKITPKTIEVLDSQTCCYGGLDMDSALVLDCVIKLRTLNPNLSSMRVKDFRELRTKCEGIRERLSSRLEVVEQLYIQNRPFRDNSFKRRIFNDIFNLKLDELFQKLLKTQEKLFENFDIILMGGASRMPLINDLLETYRFKVHDLDKNKDLVARGAAYHQSWRLSNKLDIPLRHLKDRMHRSIHLSFIDGSKKQIFSAGDHSNFQCTLHLSTDIRFKVTETVQAILTNPSRPVADMYLLTPCKNSNTRRLEVVFYVDSNGILGAKLDGNVDLSLETSEERRALFMGNRQLMDLGTNILSTAPLPNREREKYFSKFSRPQETGNVQSGVTIGIDMGTSKCCVGGVKQDHIEIFESEFGARTTPSYVAFSDIGRLVGEAAKENMKVGAQNTIYGPKKFLGKKYSEVTNIERKKFSSEVQQENSDLSFSVNYQGKKRRLTPVQVCSMLLKSMKRLVENKLACRVSGAVIAVPTYFGNIERKAVLDAASAAELKVISMINEPTAAAINFRENNRLSVNKNILVFDVGAGGMNIALVVVEEHSLKVKGVTGTKEIGGDIFVETVMSKIEGSHNLENRELERLRLSCEKAIHNLTSLPRAVIQVDNLASGRDLKYPVERYLLDEIISPHKAKIINLLNKLFEDTGISKKYIDKVVLVGGSTRIPAIQNILTKYFGRDGILNKTVNPDFAVAYGAARHAAYLSGSNSVDELKIFDLVHSRMDQEKWISVPSEGQRIVCFDHAKIFIDCFGFLLGENELEYFYKEFNSSIIDEVKEFDSIDEEQKELSNKINEFEKFCIDTKHLYDGGGEMEGKMTETDRMKIVDLCNAACDWKDDNIDVTLHSIAEKRKELEAALEDLNKDKGNRNPVNDTKTDPNAESPRGAPDTGAFSESWTCELRNNNEEEFNRIVNEVKKTAGNTNEKLNIKIQVEVNRGEH